MFKKLFKTSKYAFLIAFSALTLAACGDSDIEPEDPAVVIQKAQEANIDMKTGHTEMTFDVDVAVDSEKVAFSGELSGDVDQTDLENIKMSMDLDLAADIQAGGENVKGELGLGMVLLGDDYYLKLSAIDADHPEFEAVKPFIEFYVDQWVKLSLDDLLPPELSGQLDTSLSMQKEIQEIVKDAKLINVTEDHGIKKYDGRNVYHYSVTLDQEGVEAYMGEVFALQGVDAEVDGAEFEAAMDLAFPIILSSIEKFDMWIDAETYYTLKTEIELSIDAEALGGGVVEAELMLENSKINEPVTIEAPADAIDFAPLMEGFARGEF